MRHADQAATQSFGISEAVLMEHAAMALVAALRQRFGPLLPKTRGWIVAGSGNNGGDVLAAARLLHQEGCTDLRVVCVSDKLSPTAETQRKSLESLGVPIARKLGVFEGDWVLDGVFGTGLCRPVEGAPRAAIEAIAALFGRAWIVSADVPSGLSADTGLAQPVAVRANHTVCFGFYKMGLLTGDAGNYVGRLELAPIGIPRECAREVEAVLWEVPQARRALPPRPAASHKGTFGKVSILAGGPNQEGAAALVALAALRTGAGTVTVRASRETLDSLRPRLVAEVMTAEWSAAPVPADHVLVVGPGFGLGAGALETLEQALQHPGPLVLDADALTLLGTHPALYSKLKDRAAATVLTPHPKEAACLLGAGETAQTVQTKRYATVKTLSSRSHCTVLLKGYGTLIADMSAKVRLIGAGDAGLAKGGSGDTLAGITAAWLAQGAAPLDAACLAALALGTASERLTQRYGHTRSSLASEVSETLPLVLREWEWGT